MGSLAACPPPSAPTLVRLIAAPITALLAAPALAQGPPGLPPDIQAALDQWRGDHGSTWEVVLDEETLMGRLLFNGSGSPGFQPQNDSDWFLLARAHLMDAHGVLGIDDDTLVNDRVVPLPMGIIGTIDKSTVRFRQEVSGVPVIGGAVNALFDAEANLFSLSTDALPGLSGFDVQATVTANDAANLATNTFVSETGFPAGSVVTGTPVLSILQLVTSGQRAGVLVWDVDVSAEDGAGNAAAFAYRIAAQGSASVVDREDRIHFAFQQGQQRRGKVEAYVVIHPEHRPDPRDGTFVELRPMAYMYVKNTQGNILTTTDGNGEFSVPAGVGPVTVKIDFKGLYANTCNAPDPPQYGICTACNQNDSKSVTLTNAYTSIVMHELNATYDEVDEEFVAQANCVYLMGQMRDWIRTVDPMDATFDGGAPWKIRPNRPVCNGGGSQSCSSPGGPSPIVWFSKSMGTCENTAFSTFVWHEMGHALNKAYGNGNHKDGGFGEGNADVWAMYIADDPNVGLGVPGYRTGTNLDFFFCGDCDRGFPPPAGCDDCQGCNGGSHAGGQVLMGALWKVRAQLKIDLANDALGATVANTLFLAWMNAFDQGRIQSIIEYQWLILDAPGGGILSNALHLPSIDAGFIAQGFPGFTMPPVRYVCN